MNGVVVDNMYFNRSDIFVYFKYGENAFDRQCFDAIPICHLDVSWSSAESDSGSNSESDSDYIPSSSDSDLSDSLSD